MAKPAAPEKIMYEGQMFEVVEQPMLIGEKEVNFELVRRAPGVRVIIPRKDGKILLSKEFRSYINDYDIRLPGGKVFDSLREYDAFRKTGDDIAEAARRAAIREAREEVGLHVKKLEFLYRSICGATVEWDLYYFVASEYAQGEQELEPDEDITPILVDEEEAKRMCLDGRIQEERSALILLRYLSK